ncbi:hypothetical protein ACFFGH_16945 [Lysobacter korlensis]|uniref:Uncharacterized protein n=1 Tax=Lysobacter korlensis TaxID=553636 RepID=A0ABV6RSZ6_9GAMM
MNALTSLFSTSLPRPANRTNVLPMVARPTRRERDYGVGYGSSSGYATARTGYATAARAASGWTAPRYRFG